jgi:hypothetical protein
MELILIGMKTTIMESIFGIFAVDEKGVIDKVLFPKSITTIANKLIKLQRGETIGEIYTLISKMKEKGYDHFIFENENLAESVKNKLHVDTSFTRSSAQGRLFREKFDHLILEQGIVRNKEEIRKLLMEVSLSIAVEQLRI